MRLLLLAVLAFFSYASPSQAVEPGRLARQALESGKLEEGETSLAARLEATPTDNEARFGLGLVQFALALQHFGERQYRYGLRLPPDAGMFLHLPVLPNPSPEEITYESQRDALQGVLDDLARVDATLAPMTPDATAIVIDLNAVQFHFGAQAETLGQIVANLRGPGATQTPGPLEVKFKYADALWLRGYCHLISAALEFVLGYDWRADFVDAGRLFYPRVGGDAMPSGAEAGPHSGFLGDDRNLADLIVLIHNWRWQVSDAARLARAHAHLKQTVALSRENWKALLASVDDDRDWIAGPGQSRPAIPGMIAGQAQVDAWLGFLDEFDAALDGKVLLGHWRFRQGFNLKRVLLEPRRFDLVLWIAGQGAVPYLEEGPTLSAQEWGKWNRAFHDNFLLYAFYFN